ncbi:MAG: DUF4783 domain-containing protein [Saprospiraceae bacterium]
MKLLTVISASILFFIPFMVFSQNAGIDAAINKGNATELKSFLADKVDVSILNEDASFTSSEAVSSLATFFTQNTVKGYKLAHMTPAANGRSSYSLGDLNTSSGTYRVYLYYDGKQKISEIRIEK